VANLKPRAVYFTSHAVAKLLRVSPSTVLSWIDRGLVSAHRTPGGHRRVRRDDLIAFLKQQELPVPAVLGGARSLLLLGFDPAVQTEVSAHLPELTVHFAQDIVDGLLKLGALRPDAVLLDATRDDLRPLDLVRRIRNAPELTDMLILLAGPQPRAPELDAFTRAGANGWLTRPSDGSALREALALA
jgi:excisionase family DNA binding protein